MVITGVCGEHPSSNGSDRAELQDCLLLSMLRVKEPPPTDELGEVTWGLCTGVSVSGLLQSSLPPSSNSSSSSTAGLLLYICRQVRFSIMFSTSVMREGPRSTVKEVRESDRVLVGRDPLQTSPSWNGLSRRETRGRVINPEGKPAESKQEITAQLKNLCCHFVAATLV